MVSQKIIGQYFFPTNPHNKIVIIDYWQYIRKYGALVGGTQVFLEKFIDQYSFIRVWGSGPKSGLVIIKIT
jgi:hypothetical protein